MNPERGSFEAAMTQAQTPKPKPKRIPWELDVLVIAWLAVLVALLIRLGVI
jgi:hypothetical protein